MPLFDDSKNDYMDLVNDKMRMALLRLPSQEDIHTSALKMDEKTGRIKLHVNCFGLKSVTFASGVNFKMDVTNSSFTLRYSPEKGACYMLWKRFDIEFFVGQLDPAIMLLLDNGHDLGEVGSIIMQRYMMTQLVALLTELESKGVRIGYKTAQSELVAAHDEEELNAFKSLTKFNNADFESTSSQGTNKVESVTKTSVKLTAEQVNDKCCELAKTDSISLEDLTDLFISAGVLNHNTKLEFTEIKFTRINKFEFNVNVVACRGVMNTLLMYVFQDLPVSVASGKEVSHYIQERSDDHCLDIHTPIKELLSRKFNLG